MSCISGIIAFQTKKSNLERDLRKETDSGIIAFQTKKLNLERDLRKETDIK